MIIIYAIKYEYVEKSSHKLISFVSYKKKETIEFYNQVNSK